MGCYAPGASGIMPTALIAVGPCPMRKARIGVAVSLLLSFPLYTVGAPRQDAWKVLSLAIDGGGKYALDALAFLGAIDDDPARQLRDRVLEGRNGSTVAAVASGLTPAQCASHLQDLKRAALNPAIPIKTEILKAIARANSREAAQALIAVAHQADQSSRSVAFGLLESMGSVGVSFLQKESLFGQSALSRETAITMLTRLRVREAIPVFASTLLDANDNVRTAAALGLASWGIADGHKQLLVAADQINGSYRIDALVSLAMLGDNKAFATLANSLRTSDEPTKLQTVWAIARSRNPRLKAFAYEMKLDENPEYRAMLAEKLLNPNDERDATVLRAALADPNQVLALIAAKTLMSVGRDQGAENLVSNALTSSTEEVRRRAAELALDQEALWPKLSTTLSATSDPMVVLAALSAIAKLRQTEKFDDVARYLTSDVEAITTSAAKTLAMLNPQKAQVLFEDEIRNTATPKYLKICSSAMLLVMRNGSLRR